MTAKQMCVGEQRNSPSMSNLCMMIASSTSLGMYPSERMAMPSSCLEMNPLPSRSRTLNASRISAKTNKCATQHLRWLPITRHLTGRPPLSNDCSNLPPSLHLLLHQWRQTLLCCFFPQNACQILTLLFISLLKTALNIWFFSSHTNTS